MPEIFEETATPAKKIFCVHEEHEVIASHYWRVDGHIICDDCFQNYSDLVKCQTEDCPEYDDPKNFTDGFCDSCGEINTPLDPQVQKGWEDNIRKWNEN